MIVINKTNPARPLVMSKPSPVTLTGIVQSAPVVLRPGANEIDAETAKQLESSATVKEWLKRGWLEAKKPSVAGKGTKGEPATGVMGFESDQAVALVQDCFDVGVLARWKECDAREDVRVAIVERVAALKAATKDSE